jgi:hypothetical protein
MCHNFMHLAFLSTLLETTSGYYLRRVYTCDDEVLVLEHTTSVVFIHTSRTPWLSSASSSHSFNVDIRAHCYTLARHDPAAQPTAFSLHYYTPRVPSFSNTTTQHHLYTPLAQLLYYKSFNTPPPSPLLPILLAKSRSQPSPFLHPTSPQHPIPSNSVAFAPTYFSTLPNHLKSPFLPFFNASYPSFSCFTSS